MAAPILWTPGKIAFFQQENLHVHKIPRFFGGGGILVFFGGGKCRFSFYVVNGGFQTVVRVWSGEQVPAPHFNLKLTSIIPLLSLNFDHFLTSFYLILTSTQPAISNHGLETTVYKPLEEYFQSKYPAEVRK